MADSTYEIVRNHGATEAGLSLNTKDWAYAIDTRRLVIQDGGTKRYFWDSTRLADQTSSYGTALIGTPGITGVTPVGGSSGAAGTLQAMLQGLKNAMVSGAGLAPSGAIYKLAYWTATDTVSSHADLTFTPAASTSASVLFIDNPLSTGTSSSELFLQVSGGSGGDPFILLNIVGALSWAVGVDNSDSDAFVITPSSTTPGGAANAVRITPGGVVTLPNLAGTGPRIVTATVAGVLGATDTISVVSLTISDFSADAVGAITRSVTKGLVIGSAGGSTSIFSLLDTSGALILSVPAGTNNLSLQGDILLATAAKGIVFQAGPKELAGSGSPESAVTAPVGSTFRRSDGGAGTSFYVKESGSGNTGWVGK